MISENNTGDILVSITYCLTPIIVTVLTATAVILMSRYRKNIKALFIVHPSNTIKLLWATLAKIFRYNHLKCSKQYFNIIVTIIIVNAEVQGNIFLCHFNAMTCKQKLTISSRF